ncbi:MAG: TIGR03032 family protein [bacterium]
MDEAATGDKFALTTSRGFDAWLARAGGSLAFTTYQAGKLFMLGLRPNSTLAVFERSFPRCMGLAVSPDARSLLLASHYQLLRLDNALPPGQAEGEYDAIYVPRLAWITGDLDIHDVAFDGNGRPVFVSTLFSCLATVQDGWSFRPLWQPSFISRLAAEDRCHLNGLAMADGQPRYVTAISQSNLADGWRDRRSDGGVVIDLATGQVVCDGLSMPHSPRCHDGRLWLLNSGNGTFGHVDPVAGVFHPLTVLPGFARGLTFIGPYAVVGLSLAREAGTFAGIPLDGVLKSHGTEPRCGLVIIDTRTGDIIAWLRIEGVVRELYDVAFLPGLRNPSLIGFKSDEITRIVTIAADVADGGPDGGTPARTG